MFIKKFFPLRRILGYLFISLLIGGTVYVKQSTIYKEYVEKLEVEINSLKRNHVQEVSLLESQLNSLISRIKHLSADNTRLTATGHKLYQQLEDGNLSIEEKLAANRKLFLELSTLDKDIIHKYELFIEQQKGYEKLRFECKNGKVKNKMCEAYSSINAEVKAMEQQLKHMNAKREILLSQIDRTSGNL